MTLPLKNTLLWVILIIPPALVTGPFLSDFAVSLSGIIFLCLSIKEGSFLYYFNRTPVIIFFAWCLFLVINYLISYNYLLSLESSLFYFRFGLFSLAVWFMLENNANFGKYFSYSISFIFILLLIDGFIQFFLGINLLGYEYSSGRLGSLFGDELVLGNYLSRLSPFLFAFIALYYFKSKNIFILAMIILVLTDVLIYIAGERTGFFNLFLSTIIILLFTENWKRIRAFTFLISIVIITILTLSINSVKERLVDQTLNDFYMETEIIGNDLKQVEGEVTQKRLFFFSTRHEAMAKISINMFLDNPVSGIGTKLFRVLCSEKKYYSENYTKSSSCDTHPHNVFFQLLAETGTMGILPYLAIVFWIIYLFVFQSLYLLGIYKSKKPLSDFQVCMYAAVCISVWPLIPSLNFFNNWISVIYYLPAGFILHSHYVSK